MFFDIAWPELLLIGVIALVVIGPKDLPRALRVAGHWVRKARTLSREFQSSVEQMVREAELEEMRQSLKKATEFDVANEINKTIDPDGKLAESIRPPDVPDYLDSTPTSVAAQPEPEIELEPELPLLPPGEPRVAEAGGVTEAAADTPAAQEAAPEGSPPPPEPAPSRT
jgi:sec-independent protein translocase protein TatB